MNRAIPTDRAEPAEKAAGTPIVGLHGDREEPDAGLRRELDPEAVEPGPVEDFRAGALGEDDDGYSGRQPGGAFAQDDLQVGAGIGAGHGNGVARSHDRAPE